MHFGNTYLPPVASPAAAALGVLLGYGIVYGIERAKAKEYAVARIAIAVGDLQVPASDQQEIKDGKADEALRVATRNAIDLLVKRVSELTPEDVKH